MKTLFKPFSRTKITELTDIAWNSKNEGYYFHGCLIDPVMDSKLGAIYRIRHWYAPPYAYWSIDPTDKKEIKRAVFHELNEYSLKNLYPTSKFNKFGELIRK